MNFSDNNIYIVLVIILVIFLFFINSKFSESFQSTATTSTGYQADIEAVRNLSDIAKQLTSSSGLIIPGQLTVNNKLSVSGIVSVTNSTSDGGRFSIMNANKQGQANQVSDWSIMNTSGTNNNKLSFMRYTDATTNIGSALDINDDSSALFYGNTTISGILNIGSGPNKDFIVNRSSIIANNSLNAKAGLNVTGGDLTVSNNNLTVTGGDITISGNLSLTGLIKNDLNVVGNIVSTKGSINSKDNYARYIRIGNAIDSTLRKDYWTLIEIRVYSQGVNVASATVNKNANVIRTKGTAVIGNPSNVIDGLISDGTYNDNTSYGYQGSTGVNELLLDLGAGYYIDSIVLFNRFSAPESGRMDGTTIELLDIDKSTVNNIIYTGLWLYQTSKTFLL